MVAAGYAIAVLLGCLAVALRVASEGPEAVAESGMRAFGDLVLGVGVFGACALVPTAAALYFLRPHRTFWDVLAFTALALSATAVAAAALYVLGRQDPAAVMAGAFAVFRLLVAPVLASGFLLAAIFAPYRWPRLALACAFALEAGAFVYAVLVMTGVIGNM
jgi:hypothetical protein